MQLCSFSSCPNSDGDDSRAPALCLICGEMLCSQSYCCQTEIEGDKVGACAAHARKCGAGVGVFLRVRECHILLMANKNKGCFYSPPYLDAYGETDQGLRWVRENSFRSRWHLENVRRKLWVRFNLKFLRSDCLFSPLAATNFHAFSYENLVLDQDNNFYLISLNTLITWIDFFREKLHLMTFGS